MTVPVEPFLGELRIMAFGYAPRGWAMCNGQLLPINQNQALFSLLGTMYGGNGSTTFALPDLRGHVPIHRGAGFIQGHRAGEQTHTLTLPELPTHIHAVQARGTNADTPVPTGNVLAAANNLYAPPANLTALHSNSVTVTGGSQAHENMQPYLTLNVCIALVGVFPSMS